MKLPVFAARYFSSTAGTTGCRKEFIAQPRPQNDFSAAVVYHCDLCKTRHNFSLQEAYHLATPKQLKNFENYCDKNGITRYIEITS